MKWISVKDQEVPCEKLVLVTDGTNLGYVKRDFYPEKERDLDDWGHRYVSGIPDCESHQMIEEHITFWIPIPKLPKD